MSCPNNIASSSLVATASWLYRKCVVANNKKSFGAVRISVQLRRMLVLMRVGLTFGDWTWWMTVLAAVAQVAMES